MSLLEIVQDAASQLKLRKPSGVAGSQDLTAQTLLRFANQGLKELVSYHDWQGLIVERTFSSVGTVKQTGCLPDDYLRFPLNPEIWNRTTNQRYTGPTPQRFWQQLQSGITGGVAGWWRILGNEMHIYPAVTAGNTIAFEYISKNAVLSAGGDGQEKFEADTDEPVVPASLVTLEIVWRFRHANGFAQYAEDLATCEREKEKLAAADRGTGRIRPVSAGSETMVPPPPFWSGTLEN